MCTVLHALKFMGFLTFLTWLSKHLLVYVKLKYKVRHFTALYTLHLKETKELHRKGQVIKKKMVEYTVLVWSVLSQ